MSGYCATGNVLSVTKPAMTMTIAMTVEKTGLSIKNFVNMASLIYRFDFHSCPDFQQGFCNKSLVGRQS